MAEYQNVVLFDGHCNLCNASVNFIINHDNKKIFYFSALQSKYGREYLSRNEFSQDSSTFVYVENGKVYSESTAALRVTRKLNFPWPTLYFFIVVPKFIRDFIYRFIARNRYRVFGKKDSCRMSEPGLESRFILN